MTRLGLSSYSVAWNVGVPGYEAPSEPLDVFGLLGLADELGLGVVQIADNLPLHLLTENTRQRLRRLADEKRISLEVGTRGILPVHLEHYLQIARELGSPILRVVVDTADHHPSAEEVIALLRPQLPIFAKNGITLSIENHDRFKARTLADIITTLNHPFVGICLDTVNSFGALEGPEVVVAELGRFVVNLHVKEFVVRRVPHNMGFIVTGAPAGQGMLNIPWLLDTLQRQGRSFNAILETWLYPETSMTQTVALEMIWVRQSVQYLRTLILE